MAVTFDSTFEKGAASASPFSFVSNAGTVAGSVGSNSNRVLIAAIGFNSTVAGAGTVAVTWAGASMTAITQRDDGVQSIFLFGLIAPATGAQTLSVSWTGSASQVALGAVSVYNADQVTGWQNAATATGTSNSASIAITTTSGDMAVSGRTDNNASSAAVTVGTNAWEERVLSGNYSEAYNAASGTSTTITWSLGSSVAWAISGVSVMQSAAVGVATLGGGQTLFRPRLWTY